MNSLQELNYLNATTVIEYNDFRYATVLFSNFYANDVIYDITTQTVNVTPSIDIIDIVNYETTLCTYKISIITSGSPPLVGSTLTFNTLPAGVSLSQAGNVYTLTGINNVDIWNAIKSFTWNLPADFESCKVWYLKSEILYFDESVNAVKSKVWQTYDVNHYGLSVMEANFNWNLQEKWIIPFIRFQSYQLAEFSSTANNIRIRTSPVYVSANFSPTVNDVIRIRTSKSYQSANFYLMCDPDAPSFELTPSTEVFSYDWSTTTVKNKVSFAINIKIPGQTIDWGDGALELIDFGTNVYSHTYSSPNTYRVKISNEQGIYGFFFDETTTANFVGCNGIGVNWRCAEAWYDEIPPSTPQSIELIPRTVRGTNLVFNFPNYIPKSFTNISGMFNNCTGFNKVLNWDTSNVTNMSTLFKNCDAFNQEVNFDTSKVTLMYQMFYGCHTFNQPVNFNTSNVTNMYGTFMQCHAFTQPVNWDTSKVTRMDNMFAACLSFNQPLNFNTKNVTVMDYMFASCLSFNQPVNFNTKNVTNMSYMFNQCPEFDQNISSWDVHLIPTKPTGFDTNTSVNWTTAEKPIWGSFGTSYVSMNNYFNVNAILGIKKVLLANMTTDSNLQCNLSVIYNNSSNMIMTSSLDFVTNNAEYIWTTTSTNKVVSITTTATNADSKIIWGDGNITTIATGTNTYSNTYTTVNTFNVIITDVSNISGFYFGTTTNATFVGCNNFGYNWGNTSAAYTTNVAVPASIELIPRSVRNTSINFNIPDKLPTNITNIQGMFSQCNGFNKPINWDTSNITNMMFMFSLCSAFNQLLNLNTSNVTNMYGMFNQCIVFNQPLNLNTSNVTNMYGMFNNCKVFNQPVNFNTSNVTDMRAMFSQCSAFNQPLNFNTSNVTKMGEMFNYCSAFNQPLNFNTSNVTQMYSMFYNCSAFNQPLVKNGLIWNTGNVTDMYSMFYGCTVFDKNISSWDVHLIPGKPTGFDTNTSVNWTTAEKPVWGTTGA